MIEQTTLRSVPYNHSAFNQQKNQSKYQNKPLNDLQNDLIQHLENIQDKHEYFNTLSTINSEIYQKYAAQNYVNNAINKELYTPVNKSTVKLDVPVSNSLTDSMLRTTLGCEENLAHSYLLMVDTHSKIEGQQKSKRIEMIKQKFATSNNYRDNMANSKAFNLKDKYNVSRPVIDNEHQTYLKTHLLFMEKPNSNKKNHEYYDKHTETIARKINEIGGIQDSVTFMEQSLQRNELNNIKNRSDYNLSDKGKNPRLGQKVQVGKTLKQKSTWVNKYKQMRQTIASKLFL